MLKTRKIHFPNKSDKFKAVDFNILIYIEKGTVTKKNMKIRALGGV